MLRAETRREPRGPNGSPGRSRSPARLQHPHILPLLDSGDRSRLPLLLMPFVEGEVTARTRLAGHGELAGHDAVKILLEVVRCPAYAHAQGSRTATSSPTMCMLSGRHALVIDFGVAKAVSESTGMKRATTAGVALGTPAYMAPEQAARTPVSITG